uniref:Uncharacterized protein n=1 Tax=Klebsiella pneumoniae TaxID=573 RepID=A0A8B0SUW8_KLEPN|nr:hypothetical protein [Klebsiella pneumoniae]
MSTVTAITNINELSPSPKGGNTRATLETQNPALRQGSFSLPAPVRPNKPEYIPLPPEPDEHAGRGFLWGMV